ncbi:MAG TPA: exo-beta-N-acetylmuramidase NamZ domain-containing protein [Bryobacteraceae bacterium]|nr:exo-beta-N-acetylmuramidase NamZ domain-containing protein [Bryobacteraceae bacterium]
MRPGYLRTARTAVAALGLCPLFALAQSFSASPALDAQVEASIRAGQIPGAVLVVGQVAGGQTKILHRKAYGQRSLVPTREPMTVDTIFDAASLTKVLATTPAIMKLFEQGKIVLSNPVTTYLPEFQGGKSAITVRDLMTHFSGLRPDLDLEPAWSGYDTGIRKALAEKSEAPPGQRFVYSDINFELLGEIVRRVSGKPLNEFAREVLYEPLDMRDSTFLPPASLIPRIAPTENNPATGKPFRGVVHDPTARYMGGVAGHAGLFTTADDVALYAGMLLGAGPRVFSPLTVTKFTTPNSPPDQPILRGLGWDIDSPYSSLRGELYPIGSYGHTGFTGTSLWIDPTSKSYVILMTNRVHPNGGVSINALRARLATIAAAALGVTAPGVTVAGYNETLPGARRAIAPNHQVLTGLDVLEEDRFAALAGRKVGLITNHTGVDRAGRRNIDVMRAAGVNLVAIFAPEHGLFGKLDQPNIKDETDAATGLPVRSLYDNSRYQLTPEMLRGVDTLVMDIQDAGARFYTYGCLMLIAVEVAGKNKLPFYLLDRPNPVTGVHVEGPVLEAALHNVPNCYALPVRHGLTLGELATMANAERKLGTDLHVIRMKNWQRGDWFDSTGLTWIDPSPNLRSLNAATLYAGVAMIESAKNYSVGRGTDAPFEQIGTDWIHGAELAQFLNARAIPGVRVYATRFTPTDSVFKAKTIEGDRFVITNRDLFDSVHFGLEIAHALQKLYPGKIDFEACRFSIGSRKVVDALKSGEEPSAIEQRIQEELAGYLERRKPFLLY